MIIGTFTKQGKEYHGQIKTLRLAAELKLTPIADKPTEKSPDYRILRDNIEIGAGWNKKTKEKRPFVSILLDDPSFAAPLNCALFDAEGDGYNLVWTRQQ